MLFDDVWSVAPAGMDEDDAGASLGHRQEKMLNGCHAPVIAVIAVIAVVSRASAAGPIEEDPQPVIQGAWRPWRQWRHVPRQGVCLYTDRPGPTTLERTLLVTACHAHDLAGSLDDQRTTNKF